MRVAAIQHDISWEDAAATMAHVRPLIHDAATRGAGLIVLTEMFAVGFSMRTEVTAEPLDGPSASFLAAQAESTGAWVCGSIPVVEPGQDRPHNTLVLAGPDGTRHRYDKIHRFSFAGEDEHFLAGDDTITVPVGDLRLSPLVCFDLRFAPEFWRLAPTTDCYVVVANWPASRHEHWTTLLRARAIENQAWVLGVNRVGTGGDLTYRGDSALIDPSGTVVADATPGEEAVIVADVDPGVVVDVRARFPFLADRDRPTHP